MNQEGRAREIANMLLEIGAVHLKPEQPFTWTSGLRSPIYCDNRLTMSFPEARKLVATGFADWIREHAGAADVIAGTATAGIPHAAWVAEQLSLPMVYVRDKAKGHGRQNQIEGRLQQGQQVVVIEDLISTGGSAIQAAKAIREQGCHVLAVLAIFSYQFDLAHQAFQDAGFSYDSLSNYSVLLGLAREQGIVKAEQMEELSLWRQNPKQYTKLWNEQRI
jgi:orotate phosphoribosyltransferase